VFHKQPKVDNSSTSKRLEKQKRQKGQKPAKRGFFATFALFALFVSPASPRNCYLGDETCLKINPIEFARKSHCAFNEGSPILRPVSLLMEMKS
jgi:hypothetical protein